VRGTKRIAGLTPTRLASPDAVRLLRGNRLRLADVRYGPRLGDALAWAAYLHSAQTRKGKTEPYLTHLLRVTGLVLKFGGSEDQAIAGALHDAPEDCGGQPVLAEIGRRFGAMVAQIVKDCSDSLVEDPDGKAPWRERKISDGGSSYREGSTGE